MDELTTQIEEINAIREHGNFQTLKKRFGEREFRNILLRLYPKYTTPQIEEMTGIPGSTLSNWFIHLGIARERWHSEIISQAGNRDSEIIVRDGEKVKRKYIVEMTPDLAYLIGFCLGDGSIQKYTVEVFNKDTELREYLYSILKNYGPIGDRGVRDYGLWVLRLNSVRITNLIKNGKEINKKTIDYIFNRRTLARSFVAAFWDAEGRVAPQSKHFAIYLYNTNKYLIDKVGEFLTNQKIEYSIHSRFDPERQYTLKGRVVKSKKILHRISIPKGSSLIWAKEIGVFMKHSKKRQIVSEIVLSLKT